MNIKNFTVQDINSTLYSNKYNMEELILKFKLSKIKITRCGIYANVDKDIISSGRDEYMCTVIKTSNDDDKHIMYFSNVDDAIKYHKDKLDEFIIFN